MRERVEGGMKGSLDESERLERLEEGSILERERELWRGEGSWPVRRELLGRREEGRGREGRKMRRGVVMEGERF